MTMKQRQPSKIDVHVGQRLRLMRISRKMSQEALGDKVKITFQQIQKYERGANRIGASRLWAFCKIFDVQPNYFYEGLDTVLGSNSFTLQDSIADKQVSKTDVQMVNAFSGIKDTDVKRTLLKLTRKLAAAEE